MSWFQDMFYRQPWESYGVGLPRKEFLDALMANVGGHNARVNALDGKRPIRCLDANRRAEFLKELYRRFGKLPPYNLERFNCNHETIVRLGQAAQLWDDLSDGNEALGMGFSHLWYEDANRPHLAWFFLEDIHKMRIIQVRSFEVVERPIKNMWSAVQT